jgi:hypothetical protein
MIARLKQTLRNPVIFGIAAGLLIVLLDLAIGTLFGGSVQAGYELFANNDPLWNLVPVAVAVQMGLFRYYLNLPVPLVALKTEVLGASGAVFTSVTLVTCCMACCVMPVWSLLPAIGVVIAASSFFMQYQEAILIAALLANAIGSIVLLLLIYRRKNGR